MEAASTAALRSVRIHCLLVESIVIRAASIVYAAEESYSARGSDDQAEDDVTVEPLPPNDERCVRDAAVN